jgi:hypothetical protein
VNQPQALVLHHQVKGCFSRLVLIEVANDYEQSTVFSKVKSRILALRFRNINLVNIEVIVSDRPKAVWSYVLCRQTHPRFMLMQDRLGQMVQEKPQQKGWISKTSVAGP